MIMSQNGVGVSVYCRGDGDLLIWECHVFNVMCRSSFTCWKACCESGTFRSTSLSLGTISYLLDHRTSWAIAPPKHMSIEANSSNLLSIHIHAKAIFWNDLKFSCSLHVWLTQTTLWSSAKWEVLIYPRFNKSDLESFLYNWMFCLYCEGGKVSPHPPKVNTRPAGVLNVCLEAVISNKDRCTMFHLTNYWHLPPLLF